MTGFCNCSEQIQNKVTDTIVEIYASKGNGAELKTEEIQCDAQCANGRRLDDSGTQISQDTTSLFIQGRQVAPDAEANKLMNPAEAVALIESQKNGIAIIVAEASDVVITSVLTRIIEYPSASPSESSEPSSEPSLQPTQTPSIDPSLSPTSKPSSIPSSSPSLLPSSVPSSVPSSMPSRQPSSMPSETPSLLPSLEP
eukprot:CAMPEP_0194083904 /NCGR_PEP_ID=MMETSP0149-20130528/10353_1 /TAXON_ID=122233 /ORGANISM="Chaetoceros debilis, Strain MM31A-1" /LENGTH=197 /DNA_ID=CAMNT_0038766385 /DNA_START=158 /DNA_END=748 /DNA_ORIENTATION=-